VVADILIVETCTESIPEPRVIHVDDDAASDPGPGNLIVSDPLEDGTEAHPFDSVQEGIDAAEDRDTVLVHDGRYVETIELPGKAITVTAQWLTDPTVHAPSVIDADGLGPAVHCLGGRGRATTLSGLTVTGGRGQAGAAILCEGAEPYFSNCLISGNAALAENGTVVACIDSKPHFVNCTISGNRAGTAGGILGFDHCDAMLVNSIVWANDGPGLVILSGARPEILYSDIAFAWGGLGMLYTDPHFADPGYWDELGTPDDLTDDVWIEGDYHLESGQGRFDVATESWMLDSVNSPCIDAGDPTYPAGGEPQPSGGRINMGLYGGTTQASKSP
jgi:hypothetical protein